MIIDEGSLQFSMLFLRFFVGFFAWLSFTAMLGTILIKVIGWATER